MKGMHPKRKLVGLIAGLLIGAYAPLALAATSGGLPWDSPVQALQSDLTGPIATGISVVAFLAAGAALVFGEELGGIAKKALFVVMGVAMIVLGSSFLSALGLTGAVI